MAVVFKKKGDWLEAALPALSSKTDRILAHLLSGGSITVLEATLNFGLTSLAARIAHFRHTLKVPIETLRTFGATGQIHGRYRIKPDDLSKERLRFPSLVGKKKGEDC